VVGNDRVRAAVLRAVAGLGVEDRVVVVDLTEFALPG